MAPGVRFAISNVLFLQLGCVQDNAPLNQLSVSALSVSAASVSSD